nr:MAG TPA: hypothetical protein [Caudoviricetes sp.]
MIFNFIPHPKYYILCFDNIFTPFLYNILTNKCI